MYLFYVQYGIDLLRTVWYEVSPSSNANISDDQCQPNEYQGLMDQMMVQYFTSIYKHNDIHINALSLFFNYA